MYIHAKTIMIYVTNITFTSLSIYIYMFEVKCSTILYCIYSHKGTETHTSAYSTVYIEHTLLTLQPVLLYSQYNYIHSHTYTLCGNRTRALREKTTAHSGLCLDTSGYQSLFTTRTLGLWGNERGRHDGE